MFAKTIKENLTILNKKVKDIDDSDIMKILVSKLVQVIINFYSLVFLLNKNKPQL